MILKTFELLYSAPIPVGNRVSLQWYEAPLGGFWGNKLQIREHEPRLVDLDTNVEFAPPWLYWEGTGITPGTVTEIGRRIRSEAREIRKVEGTVRYCRVVTWVMGDGGTYVQTTLDVEVDA